jgi:hypothetical protein
MRVYVVKARDSKQHYRISAGINYTNLIMEEVADSELSAEG